MYAQIGRVGASTSTEPGGGGGGNLNNNSRLFACTGQFSLPLYICSAVNDLIFRAWLP